MRLSKRGEYGLRAMIYLASCEGRAQVVQIHEIASRENLPYKFLEQILLSLKNSGLLRSKMGLGGGYTLAKPAGEITFGQIIRVLDGPLAPIGCVSQTAYEPCSCPDEATCALRMVMLDVRSSISEVLDCTSLADIMNRQEQVRSMLGGSSAGLNTVT